MHDFMLLLLQTGLLCLIAEVSKHLAQASGLPVPGNVLGVVLLFFLLLSGVIKLRHVERAADFFVRHLVFFFIPMVVGLMNYGWMFTEYGLTLCWVVPLTIAVPFLAAGRLAQGLHKRKGNP